MLMGHIFFKVEFDFVHSIKLPLIPKHLSELVASFLIMLLLGIPEFILQLLDAIGRLLHFFNTFLIFFFHPDLQQSVEV
jgi:hypothetical protein